MVGEAKENKKLTIDKRNTTYFFTEKSVWRCREYFFTFRYIYNFCGPSSFPVASLRDFFSSYKILLVMGSPAARISDMHICPMATPGTPPIPHVGGPVTGPGCATVLIGGMPASVVGDICVCTGPPDTVVMGSTTVLIGGEPAVRMGDSTAHGGTVVSGEPTVLIG